MTWHISLPVVIGEGLEGTPGRPPGGTPTAAPAGTVPILYDGGTSSGGSLAGNGLPFLFISTKCRARQNSSDVKLPSLSTSARFLRKKTHYNE